MILKKSEKNIKKKSRTEYDVSVIIATFNPSMDKLLFTLNSIIRQKLIKLEIIITDDGSNDNHFVQIDNYLRRFYKGHYSLICHRDNVGTVLNVYDGITKAKSDFIKLLSPGDAFSDDRILFEWRTKMIKSNQDWSFSDVVCYRNNTDHSNAIIFSCLSHPQDIRPYIMGDSKKCRWNYLILDDIAIGAATLCKKSIMLQYLEKIIGKVKYAEDNIYRIMMFDGVTPMYYKKETILYEYGEGISTCDDSSWSEKLSYDWYMTDEIMLSNNCSESYTKELADALRRKKKNNGAIDKILTKGKLISYINKKIKPRLTSSDRKWEEICKLLNTHFSHTEMKEDN